MEESNNVTFTSSLQETPVQTVEAEKLEEETKENENDETIETEELVELPESQQKSSEERLFEYLQETVPSYEEILESEPEYPEDPEVYPPEEYAEIENPAQFNQEPETLIDIGIKRGELNFSDIQKDVELISKRLEEYESNEVKSFYPEFCSPEDENQGIEFLIELTINLYGGRNTKTIKDYMKEATPNEKRDALNFFYEQLYFDKKEVLSKEKETGNYNKLVTLAFKDALKTKQRPVLVPSFIDSSYCDWEMDLHPVERVGYDGLNNDFITLDSNNDSDDNLVNGFGLSKTHYEILEKKFPNKPRKELKELRIGRAGECSSQIDTTVLKEYYSDEVVDSLYNLLLLRDSVWKAQHYKELFRVLKLEEPSNLEFLELRTQLVTALSNKNICKERIYFPETFDLLQFFINELGYLSDYRTKFNLKENYDCMLFPHEFIFFRNLMTNAVNSSSLPKSSKDFLLNCISYSVAELIINKFKPLADFFNKYTHLQLLQRGFNFLTVELNDILPVKAFVSDLNYISSMFNKGKKCKFKETKDSIIEYGINNTIDLYKSVFDDFVKVNYNLVLGERKRF